MKKQQGFTIIELLIATMVFSVILLVITACVMQFTRQYYKGVAANNTQLTTRSIIDEVSRAVQFSGGEIASIAGPDGSQGYCMGSGKRYSFALNRQVSDISHGLVSDSPTECVGGTPALSVKTMGAALPDATTAPFARELLGPRMRLAKFKIERLNPADSTMYTVTVKIIYGDDDLITNPTDPEALCKSDVGSQFCSMSELKTTIKKRI